LLQSKKLGWLGVERRPDQEPAGMSEYVAPLKQIRFTLEHLAEYDEVAALPDFAP
jgi:hypothetical protein